MSESFYVPFEALSSAQWKQQLQYELKGADYHQTLVWDSLEGIPVTPFYHADQQIPAQPVPQRAQDFMVGQDLFLNDQAKSLRRIEEVMSRGAEYLRLTLGKTETLNLKDLLAATAQQRVLWQLNCQQQEALGQLVTVENPLHRLFCDPLTQLFRDGQWPLSSAMDTWDALARWEAESKGPWLGVDARLYQQAGAHTAQELAYTAAQVLEYAQRNLGQRGMTLYVAIGGHYFFEIAKLRALRILIQSLETAVGRPLPIFIIAQPSRRNKTLYDYNVNMLRTTTECMSAIIGGADVVCNLAYDHLYHKDNEFAERIARNQLLVMKHEAYLHEVYNPADGAYYIESLTRQLGEKALGILKDIEKGGGLLQQVMEGTIQRKLAESAQKEQTLYDQGKKGLVGTHRYPNPSDRMKDDLELYPFVKQQSRKTLFAPIIEKRIAESVEMQRLDTEK